MQNIVRSRSIVALVLLLLTAGLLFVLSACAPAENESSSNVETQDEAANRGAGEPEAAASDDEVEPAEPPGPKTYTVRGEIVDLPDPEDPTSAFYVYHEAIDDFRGIDGQISGMSSMAMPFPVDENLDLSDLTRGDKVEFDLYVDWDGDPATLVTRVEKLDPDTILEFRGSRPPGSDGAS